MLLASSVIVPLILGVDVSSVLGLGFKSSTMMVVSTTLVVPLKERLFAVIRLSSRKSMLMSATALPIAMSPPSDD